MIDFTNKRAGNKDQPLKQKSISHASRSLTEHKAESSVLIPNLTIQSKEKGSSIKSAEESFRRIEIQRSNIGSDLEWTEPEAFANNAQTTPKKSEWLVSDDKTKRHQLFSKPLTVKVN